LMIAMAERISNQEVDAFSSGFRQFSGGASRVSHAAC
jgi:hypothetical protein